jgi:hypothetical protein
MLTFDPQKRITAAQALKHPWFEGFTHNPAALNVGLMGSGSNKNLIDGGGQATSILGSGGNGKLPGSRAMRIESRKGILSRKSSVNKNSFYKQKAKVPDNIPNKLYGNGGSYFNKNAPPSNNNLPGLSSGGL